MREINSIMNIRYIILMIVLIISMTALLLAMTNYNDIKTYKEFIQESIPVEYYDAIGDKKQDTNIRIIKISNDDNT